MGNLITAIDVSSNQGTNIGPLIDRYAPDLVVVKLGLDVEIPAARNATTPQVATAKAMGTAVQGYCWCYRGVDPRRTVQMALAKAASSGLSPLTMLWLDMEPYQGDPEPDADWLALALDECDRAGQRVGIYTGKWCWCNHTMRCTERFKERPLWVADYSRAPNLDGWDFGGWARAAGHQFSSLGVDRSIFDPAAIGLAPVGAPTPNYSVGPGLLAAMDRQGDHPTGDEVYGQASYAMSDAGVPYFYIPALNKDYIGSEA